MYAGRMPVPVCLFDPNLDAVLGKVDELARCFEALAG